MAEYVNNDIKIIGIGDNIGIDIPKPIASINFDAYHVGTYVVDVNQDGSYSATFVGTIPKSISNYKKVEVKIEDD